MYVYLLIPRLNHVVGGVGVCVCVCVCTCVRVLWLAAIEEARKVEAENYRLRKQLRDSSELQPIRESSSEVCARGCGVRNIVYTDADIDIHICTYKH